MTSILFACVSNSCRSQMAEGFCRHFGKDVACASAGSKPAAALHHNAIDAMHEVGIDITGHDTRTLTSLQEMSFDIVVTMGCGESCPYWPGAKLVEWDIPDACGQDLERTRGQPALSSDGRCSSSCMTLVV